MDVVSNISNDVYCELKERQEAEGFNLEDDLSLPSYIEDTESEYLFVSTNPRRLVLPVSMGGKHKLCLLRFVCLSDRDDSEEDC